MMRTGFSATDLNELQRQLTSWREAQSGRARLPEEVWELASELACTQGVSYVARILRLDYYRLKREMSRRLGKSSPAPNPPKFVELQIQGGAVDGAAWRIELTDAKGAQMTVHLPGDSATVVAMAEAFWRRAP